MPDYRSDKQRKIDHKNKEWWHYGHAWLVFGGPAAVIVACMITIVIAVNGRDPLIAQDYYAHSIEISKSLGTLEDKGNVETNALEPAILARNHAVTGVNHSK